MTHSTRVKASIFSLAGFVILAADLGCGSQTEVDPTQITGTAPYFSVESLENGSKVVRLDDLKGKVVILDFWATWCGPCRKSMPFLQGIWSGYKDKGVEILGITNEDPRLVGRFRAETGVKFPLYIDKTNSAARSYNCVTIPRLFVIDRQGVVAFSHVGELDDEDEVRKAVDDALKS